jgi:hypothetical protein
MAIVMRKRKLIQSISLLLLTPALLWAESKQPENFRLTRDHSGFVEGIEGNVCKAFLEVINRIPEEKLLPCVTPDFSDSPFTLVPFTPLDSERQLDYAKRIYHRDNGTEAYRNAWAVKQKEYETGYSRLSEAFLDLDGDGVKEHVIEQMMPSKVCIPSIKGEALSTKEKWGDLSNDQRYRAAQKYGLRKHYIVLSQDKKRDWMPFIENIIRYEQRFFSTGTIFTLDLKNKVGNWSDREWVSLKNIRRNTKSNSFDFNTRCKYWLNDNK